MATAFIMLTRLAHGALRSPETLEKLEQEVKARIDQEVGKGASDARQSVRIERLGRRSTRRSIATYARRDGRRCSSERPARFWRISVEHSAKIFSGWERT